MRVYQFFFAGFHADQNGDEGRAPLMVGLDFRTITLPENVPEGCAIPLRMVSTHNMSQNVTISVRRGGGQCVDPPVESIGLITWERTVTADADGDSETAELRIEFLAASGRKLPERDPWPFKSTLDGKLALAEGPSCPLPADQRLHGGTITAKGPDWGPIELQPDESNVYRLPLPAGAIHEGTFSVTSSRGSDVGPFETSVSVPPPIQPARYPRGYEFPCCGRAFPIFRWTGGDDSSWVRISMLTPILPPVPVQTGNWLYERDALASAGIAAFLSPQFVGLPESPDAELTFTQDAMNPEPFSAPGLSQGGHHRWVYRWKFPGVQVVNRPTMNPTQK
jgi:hypothetical protein